MQSQCTCVQCVCPSVFPIVQFRKGQQKKERLLGFFLIKPKAEAAKQESSFVTPFSLKAHMTLAPRPRPPLSTTTVFDQLLQAQDFSISMESSVKELKMASPKVEKKQIEEDDVIGEWGRGVDDILAVVSRLCFHNLFVL